MLKTVIMASIMVGAVAGLLHAIRVGDRVEEVISKAAASTTFVVLGFLRWSSDDAIGTWLLAGLALCAAGDLLLLHRRAFDIGLLAFLVGHVLLIVAFAEALPLNGWSVPVLIPLLVAGAVAARWLWPHLGRRRLSVLAYIVVISLMVWGSVSAFMRDLLPWTAPLGAALFYVSDLFVARQRFVREAASNRVLGLPIYYAGQLLLALTIGAG